MLTKTLTSVRPLWTIVWKSGMFFVVWAILIAPFIVPLAATLAEWEHSSPLRARLYGDIVGAVTMLVATGVMTRFIDHRSFLAAALAPDHLIRDVLVGVGFGSLWLATSVGVAWTAGWAAIQTPVGFSGMVVLGAAIAMVFNVVTQQLLLCGYVFQVIRSQTGLGVAVGGSALLFAGYHAGTFTGAWLPVLNVFLAGLLFCLAYSLTGTLWLPIFIHFAWNVLLGPVLGLAVSGSSQLGRGWHLLVVTGPELWTGGRFGLEGGLIVTLTTVIGILTIVLVQHRRFRSVAMRSSQAAG